LRRRAASKPATPRPNKASEAGSGTVVPTDPFGTDEKRKVPRAYKASPKPSPKKLTLLKKPELSMAPMKLVY